MLVLYDDLKITLREHPYWVAHRLRWRYDMILISRIRYTARCTGEALSVSYHVGYGTALLRPAASAIVLGISEQNIHDPTLDALQFTSESCHGFVIEKLWRRNHAIVIFRFGFQENLTGLIR